MQYGGPLKPLAVSESAASDEQKWVHVLCALAIPELVMRDVPSMEPVDGFEEIENGRFRYLCAICRKRGGASVICEAENCNVGVHPQCAADAGLMIGNEGNLLGVYCDKHLPTSRIPGAKRWISDEDLVEEIMSEYSIDEDFDEEDFDTPHFTDTERYAFVLESTPYLHCKQQLLGATATLHFGPAPLSAATAPPSDIDRKTFTGAKISANAYAPPAMVVQGMSTQRPITFPPPALSRGQQRLGLPEFPQGRHAVGAIVDYLAKAQDEWQRSRVLQWDKEKKMHLVQIVASGQKMWTKLDVDNTLILYLPDEENILDGPIVKLIRPLPASGLISREVCSSVSVSSQEALEQASRLAAMFRSNWDLVSPFSWLDSLVDEEEFMRGFDDEYPSTRLLIFPRQRPARQQEDEPMTGTAEQEEKEGANEEDEEEEMETEDSEQQKLMASDFFDDLPVGAKLMDTQVPPNLSPPPSKSKDGYSFFTYAYSTCLTADDNGRRVNSTRRRYEDSAGRLKAQHRRQIGTCALESTWKRASESVKQKLLSDQLRQGQAVGQVQARLAGVTRVSGGHGEEDGGAAKVDAGDKAAVYPVRARSLASRIKTSALVLQQLNATNGTSFSFHLTEKCSEWETNKRKRSQGERDERLSEDGDKPEHTGSPAERETRLIQEQHLLPRAALATISVLPIVGSIEDPSCSKIRDAKQYEHPAEVQDQSKHAIEELQNQVAKLKTEYSALNVRDHSESLADREASVQDIQAKQAKIEELTEMLENSRSRQRDTTSDESTKKDEDRSDLEGRLKMLEENLAQMNGYADQLEMVIAQCPSCTAKLQSESTQDSTTNRAE
ncbi:hypothetical protein ON010_g9233 [Phytophthora cinnamomi]|nr:hypothetical protein ON010_g9233 [Phytophthora cinnamomi]